MGGAGSGRSLEAPRLESEGHCMLGCSSALRRAPSWTDPVLNSAEQHCSLRTPHLRLRQPRPHPPQPHPLPFGIRAAK